MSSLRLKYNPSHMPEDELIRSFVVRQRDLAVILEVVRENTGASNQHLLILGPRGMGKTTLVNRAVAEIRRDPTLGRSWYPILFDEESYTVTNAGELWYQALSHLADQTGDRQLEQARRALQPLTDRTRLRDASLARILEFADAQNKRLLLVFENIDMIFDDQMNEADGWDVRHTLQNEPRIMVLATSPTRLDSFHDSRKPLYELFREHTLERLDLEECRTVWRLVTGADLPLNQARPIQIFTGGNTRLLTILATFAKDRSFRELMDDLVGLIDENTSYFKHNIEALPPESRKIFVTLADLWSPATSRQVADQTRGDVRAVSAQLHRLVDQGSVEVVRRVDRTQMFQVAERMYNLYYLLRRRGAGRVRAVVEFIVRYYDSDGMQSMLAKMADEACDLGRDRREDHVRAYCELLQRLPDLGQRAEAFRRAPARFREIPDIADLQEMLTAKPRIDRLGESELRARLVDKPDDVTLNLQMADILHDRGDSEQALALAQRILSLDPTCRDAAQTLTRAIALSTSLSHAERSAILRRATHVAQGSALAWLQPSLAMSLARSSHVEDARDLANDALERWPDDPGTALLVGTCFTSLGDMDAARGALTHALELDPANWIAAVNLSCLLVDGGHVDEAETHLRVCVERRPRMPGPWIALAGLLCFEKHSPELALVELQRGGEQIPTDPQIANNTGYLQLQLDRFPAAEASYRRLAIELGSEHGFIGLISALVLQGKVAEARAVLLPKLGPVMSPALHIAAALLNQAERSFDEARQHLRKAAEPPFSDAELLPPILALQVRLSDIGGARSTAKEYLAGDHAARTTRLRNLSSAALDMQLTPLLSEVISWTRELAENVPTSLHGNLLLSRALALSNTWDLAWAPLTLVLADANFTPGHLREIVALISLAAARGHASHALQVLADSPSAPHFEPLLVALRRLTDQPTNPPQEVSEVADDIVRDIERLRQALTTPAPAKTPTSTAPPDHQQHRRTRKRSLRATSKT